MSHGTSEVVVEAVIKESRWGRLFWLHNRTDLWCGIAFCETPQGIGCRKMCPVVVGVVVVVSVSFVVVLMCLWIYCNWRSQHSLVCMCIYIYTHTDIFTYMHIHTDVSLNPLLPPHTQHTHYVSTTLRRPTLDLRCRYLWRQRAMLRLAWKTRLNFRFSQNSLKNRNVTKCLKMFRNVSAVFQQHSLYINIWLH